MLYHAVPFFLKVLLGLSEKKFPGQLSLQWHTDRGLSLPLEAQGQASLFETGTLHFPHARPDPQRKVLAVEFRSRTFLASTWQFC